LFCDIGSSWSRKTSRPRRSTFAWLLCGGLLPRRRTPASSALNSLPASALGLRIGNWLTIEPARSLLQEPPAEGLRAKRDRAILSILIGCGLGRAELVALTAQDFQIREDHWVIADLTGKGKHIQTVPVPLWVK
jgi:site-specific recombinase XerD